MTKFLGLLSQEEEADDDYNERFASNEKEISTLPSKNTRKHGPSKSSMHPIEEEEDLMNLADHIGDVSLADEAK